MAGETPTCEACGELMAPKKRAQGRRKQFCSQACQKWAYEHPGEKRTLKRDCANCGQPFRPKQEMSRFCSTLCSDVARGARVYGPHGMVIACELCGERRAIPMDWSKKAKTCLGCRPEWERRRMQAWRAANPERVRAQDRRRMANPAYRARKRAFMRVRYEMETGICRDPAIRTQVYMQAAGVCALCDSVVPYDGMTLDHVVPLARGGLDEIDNLQLAHFSCNARKGATV